MSPTTPGDAAKTDKSELGSDPRVQPESSTTSNPAASSEEGTETTATSRPPTTGRGRSENQDHDDIKPGLQTEGSDKAPARTDAELEIDRRVEEETKRLQDQRRQQDAQELKRRRDDFTASEKSLHIRALDARLGLVEHLGCRGVYVGPAPQSEKDDSKCPSCDQVLKGGNSKFTPLPYVVPEAGMLVKDSESGEFFALPSDGTLVDATAQTWLTINKPATGDPFVPEASTEGSQDRAKAAGLV